MLFFIELNRRRLWLAGLTAHPTGAWVTQAARNLVGVLGERVTSFEFLLRDRDAKFVAGFDTVFRSEGVRIIRTPIRAPRANAFAERWVRTARTECLDWILVLNRRHLERVLAVFVQRYNQARPHRGNDLATPIPSDPCPMHTSRHVERVDHLGGVIHEYRRPV